MVRNSIESPVSSVVFVSTYPPSRCGLATYTEGLVNSLAAEPGGVAEVAVARVIPSVEQSPSHCREVVATFRPSDPAALRAVAHRLSGYDVVVIQHEYGIYGPEEGVAVCELVDRVSSPIVVVFHTMLRSPSPSQRRIVEHLVECSSVAVVLSDAAARHLEMSYDIDDAAVTVIQHGSRWSLDVATPTLRPVVLTWGLIGRAKGLELAIEAMAGLRALRPRPVYRIVGRTHPTVLEVEGERYRAELEQLVETLALKDMVEFEPHYLDVDRLAGEVATAHVVVLPYISEDHVSSGVLSEALAAGKPVVATRFPHAEEMLSSGAGVTVDHGDSEALAAALRLLLTDSTAYREASGEARRVARGLSWQTVARRYGEVIASVTRADRASAIA